VASWADDFDIFEPGYVHDPAPVWDALRATEPVPHTERWSGSWMPVRYADVTAVAHNHADFSSDQVTVTPLPGGYESAVKAPPITSDQPDHTWARRLILPFFSPKQAERYTPHTRELANRLIDDFIADGRADAAGQYSQQIPPRIIAAILGIDASRAAEFTEWVQGVLEIGLQNPEIRVKYRTIIIDFFTEQIAYRRQHPGDDLISYLLGQEVDGRPVPELHILGTCNLMLVAGIDTTWSSIGSALWHLAHHEDDRRRLVAEPQLIPTAVEELLRAYSPVTMARIAARETTIGDKTIQPGERVLLSFPAANRDPHAFPDADKVVIDRAYNRHVAFGVGIHRCAGSNLARMEMQVALEEWLKRIPEFSLEDPSAVTWAGGQVRGPRFLPVVF
jgi:hypothetical protein